MNLLPGYRLALAPHFQLAADWSRRVLIGAGIEEEAGRLVPRPPWRAPTEAELAILTPEGPPQEQALEQCLALFRLPEHLQSSWWRLLEGMGQLTPGRLEGLDGFVAEVADLLSFKHLPVPAGAAFDLIVSQPGLRSIRPEGLSFDGDPGGSWPGTGPVRPRPWGVINLGDEATSLVLVNLSAQQTGEMLAREGTSGPPPRTHRDLARGLFAACPDYPLVRVLVGPGEGYRLPRGGILWDGCTTDKQEPDVLLIIRNEGGEET